MQDSPKGAENATSSNVTVTGPVTSGDMGAGCRYNPAVTVTRMRIVLAAIPALLACDRPAGRAGTTRRLRAAADARAQDPLAAGTFSSFRLRAVGPPLMSGRISAIAVHPDDKQTWYIGVASGGVWKTTNAGTTFTPVFQNEGSYSIGTVVIDPKNPNTIWVGTGEANNQRSVG